MGKRLAGGGQRCALVVDKVARYPQADLPTAFSDSCQQSSSAVFHKVYRARFARLGSLNLKVRRFLVLLTDACRRVESVPSSVDKSLVKG